MSSAPSTSGFPVIIHDEDSDEWLTAPVDVALSLARAFSSQLVAVA